MKMVEVFGSSPIPLSNEEYNVYTMIKKNASMVFEDLQDRNKQVALNLYFKNVIDISDKGNLRINHPEKFEDVDW
jgi:hypothetical protein